MPDDLPFNPPRIAGEPSATMRRLAPKIVDRPPYRPVVFNRRSRQRFEHDRTSQLIHHLGRSPTYPERILISRIVAVEWDLKRIDARLDHGEELSGHAMRARLAGENRLRLDLRELGLAPNAAPQMTIAEYLTRRYGRNEFLIVRMARSPPVALHPASRRRGHIRLQAGVGIPGEDLHLPDQLRSQAHGTERVGGSREN
jgi:hypothetical protein